MYVPLGQFSSFIRSDRIPRAYLMCFHHTQTGGVHMKE